LPSAVHADLVGTYNADPRPALDCHWLETADGVVQMAWPPGWHRLYDPPRLVSIETGQVINVGDQVGLDGSFTQEEGEYCNMHLHADGRDCVEFWACVAYRSSRHC